MENIKKYMTKILHIFHFRRVRNIIVFGILFITIYFTGVWYYGFHFFPNTSINNVGVGSKMPVIAEKLVDFKNKTDIFTVSFNDGTKETIDLSKVDLKINRTVGMQEIVNQQNPYLWPLHILWHNDINIKGDITVNEAKVANYVYSFSHSELENMKAPEDAYVYYDDGDFYIKNEVIGSTYDVESLNEKIIETIKEAKNTLDVTDSQLYKQPAITAEDEKLNKYYQACIRYCSAKISYKDTDISLDGKKMMDWLTYDEKIKDYKKNEQKFKEGIKELVAQASSEFNTVGKAKSFTGASGRTITINGGDLGYYVDEEKEYEEIEKIIEVNGINTEKEPVLKGFTEKENGGIGKTFIEVDIGAKKLYVCDDGKVTSYAIILDKSQKEGQIQTGVYLLQKRFQTSITVEEEKEVQVPVETIPDGDKENGANTGDDDNITGGEGEGNEQPAQPAEPIITYKTVKQKVDVSKKVVAFTYGRQGKTQTIYVPFNNSLYNSIAVESMPIIVHR